MSYNIMLTRKSRTGTMVVQIKDIIVDFLVDFIYSFLPCVVHNNVFHIHIYIALIYCAHCCTVPSLFQSHGMHALAGYTSPWSCDRVLTKLSSRWG